ncbi:MAG TPA: hypothetical protein VH835_03955 [Dongiaceae bacterium]|jgi:hypothetical protein
MVRPLIMALLTAAAYLSACHVHAAPVSQQTADAAADLKPQIAWAEAWGRALFDAYKTKSKVSDLAMDSALFTASNAVTDKCPHASYRAVLVSPPGMPADRFAVYYIGSVPREQGLMIGRHYRVEVFGDGKTALSVTPSGKNCLILPPPASGQPKAGTMVTHQLTPAPSEFHVFLSLLSGQPLYVGTKTGIWQVVNGKIQLLKAN